MTDWNDWGDRLKQPEAHNMQTNYWLPLCTEGPACTKRTRYPEWCSSLKHQNSGTADDVKNPRQRKSLQGRSKNGHPPVTRGSMDGLCNRLFSSFWRAVSDCRCGHLETDRLLQSVIRTKDRQEKNEHGKARSRSRLTRITLITADCTVGITK